VTACHAATGRRSAEPSPHPEDRSVSSCRLSSGSDSARGARAALFLVASIFPITVAAAPAWGQAVPAEQTQVGRTRITGTVTDVSTGAPVVGATVQIPGTRSGATTDEAGRYALNNVASGVITIEARRIGYSIVRRENLRVTGETMTVDLRMNSTPLSLEAVTVSASVDPTSGVKAPYAVSKITAENMPVPAMGAASTALIGKAAGVNIIQASGAPGAGSFIQLRSPSSPENDNGPLWMVDGVFLNENQSVTTQDIEGMNIASIEVIKGAAAAAIYGSRAANGVIAITTNRGKDLRLGQSQFTIRNDFGYDQFHDQPQKRRYHHFRVNDQGQWVNASGAVLPRSQRQIDPDGMVDNAYPVLYDNIGQLMRDGRSLMTQLSIAQNSAGTNFALTYTRNRQPGVVVDTYGYLRQSVNFTLDHSLRDNLTVSVSANHSRGNEVESAVNFLNLYSYDPDVDLTRRDLTGNFLARPDSASTITNPMYTQAVSDNKQRRSRTLISSNLTYRPLSWLSFQGDVGYDRGDRVVDRFTPPGLPDNDGDGVTLGSLRYDEDEVDGYTGSAGATIMRDFGGLTARLTGKGETQRERNLYFRADGTNFQIAGTRDLAAALTKTNQSTIEETRTNAGLVALALDYNGKYVADGLIRRDGSSLFGRAHRWTTFYRVGGAYLVSEEPWFPKDGLLGSLSTLKFRYNTGTAGTRPNFADQYSALSVFNHGYTRASLGNPNLKPEIKTDHEAGIDAIVKNRVQVQLTYSHSRTSDAIIGIAAPSVTGYNTQEANVGSMRSRTLEATVEGQWINGPKFKWWSNLVLDRSRSLDMNINRPCYTDGIQNMCNDSKLTDMWGQRLARSLDELRSIHSNSQSQFQINDEGYLVAVGNGNSWRDGLAKNLWGSIVRIDGIDYRFGEPFAVYDESINSPLFHKIGSSEADVRFGFGNRFNYGNFQLYALVSGQLGGDVYNNVRQNLMASLDSPEIEQVGRPDELKKPYYYYSRGLAQANTFWLKDFIESGTHAKLYELQLGYTMNRVQHRFVRLTGAERMSFQIIGRNLFTWTNYSGLRVEGGTPNERVDDDVYPITRNFTASLTLVF
jgi:TonB-linked SusC/RagA family outer membrane protein